MYIRTKSGQIYKVSVKNEHGYSIKTGLFVPEHEVRVSGDKIENLICVNDLVTDAFGVKHQVTSSNFDFARFIPGGIKAIWIWDNLGNYYEAAKDNDGFGLTLCKRKG